MVGIRTRSNHSLTRPRQIKNMHRPTKMEFQQLDSAMIKLKITMIIPTTTSRQMALTQLQKLTSARELACSLRVSFKTKATTVSRYSSIKVQQIRTTMMETLTAHLVRKWYLYIRAHPPRENSARARIGLSMRARQLKKTLTCSTKICSRLLWTVEILPS